LQHEKQDGVVLDHAVACSPAQRNGGARAVRRVRRAVKVVDVANVVNIVNVFLLQ
jgi:hypothetical protein